MEPRNSATSREYAKLISGIFPFLLISRKKSLINCINGGKISGKGVTNNDEKNLETRDSYTYLQFTIATGNFWKQRKNVARRGKGLSKDLYFF